jgi:hypothetical protein
MILGAETCLDALAAIDAQIHQNQTRAAWAEHEGEVFLHLDDLIAIQAGEATRERIEAGNPDTIRTLAELYHAASPRS